MTAEKSPVPSTRHLSDTAIAWLLFIAVGAVYASTVCRTIYTGDDGDFASAIATFGVPHPTGYPLFVLLGRLWITLTAFVGSVPYRLNLFTAVCGAGAVGVFYRFISDYFAGFSWRRVWAVVGALVFAFSPTLWNQSSSCEVYASNIFFLSLLLWLSLRFVRTEPGDEANKKLCHLALTYGFALTNHMTIALFFPAFMALVIWRKPSLFGKDWRILLAVAGCLFLPLSLYLYLPLATKYSASPNKWGYPDTPARFWNHITGAQYHVGMFSSVDSWRDGARLYLTQLLPKEYGVFLLFAAVAGLFFLLWTPRTRPAALLLLAIFIGDVVYAAGYDIVDIFVYYVPSYLSLAVMMAGAGIFLVQLSEKRLGADRMNRYAKLAFPAFLAAVAVHASVHYADADKSNNYAEAEYVESLLRSCPPGALLAVHGEVTESLWYYQFVLNERPDVLVICTDMFPAVGGWYRWHLQNRLPQIVDYLPKHPLPATSYTDGTALVETFRNALRDNRPVVVVPSLNTNQQGDTDAKSRKQAANMPVWWNSEQAWKTNFDTVPWGLTERIYFKGTAPKPDDLIHATASLWQETPSAIHPNWNRLSRVSGQDPLQTSIFLRFWGAAAAWGRTAEAGHRPDLAIPAYQHALILFSDAKTSASLERLQKQVHPPAR